MFTELAQKLHLIANPSEVLRKNRLKKENDLWFFDTREGVEVGPFLTRSDAQYALLYFTEQCEWPDKEQLREFKSGCELNCDLKEQEQINTEH